ncbi:MAG: hypothetical protein HXX14_12220 [Bacteroidetes bacterium]|nr:hypothetical protein [Bacteroidota bacterium]
MLLPTMTNKELVKEVLSDTDIIYSSSTVYRLADTYYQERLRNKISKTDLYVKFYEIKSNSKNRWIIMMERNTLHGKYQYARDVALMPYTIYYTDKGLRILYRTRRNDVAVMNAHLYERYRERMKLDIPNLLDVVKHYVEHNYSILYYLFPEVDGRRKFYGTVKEGYVMGEFIEDDKLFIQKTFICKEGSTLKATAYEKECLANVMEELKQIDKIKDPLRYNEMMMIRKALLSPEGI